MLKPYAKAPCPLSGARASQTRAQLVSVIEMSLNGMVRHFDGYRVAGVARRNVTERCFVGHVEHDGGQRQIVLPVADSLRLDHELIVNKRQQEYPVTSRYA